MEQSQECSERQLWLQGLALASSQIANGYLVSPLATEQRAGVAKLATGASLKFVWSATFL